MGDHSNNAMVLIPALVDSSDNPAIDSTSEGKFDSLFVVQETEHQSSERWKEIEGERFERSKESSGKGGKTPRL